jgi:hypothetical protein
MRLRCLQNDLIGYITTRQKDVGYPFAVFPVEVVNVCDDQYFHSRATDMYLAKPTN